MVDFRSAKIIFQETMTSNPIAVRNIVRLLVVLPLGECIKRRR